MRTARILFAGALLASVMFAANAVAQTPPKPSGTKPHTQANTQAKERHEEGEERNAIAERTPACQHIMAECRKLGYVEGQYKKDNGLWKDCFYPVIDGQTPTRDGKSVQVPVSQGDLHACRAAEHKAK